MKVLLYGRFGKHPQELGPLVAQFGFEIVDSDPEVVITYGGDGTFLGAERDWPQIPKLLLRDSDHCRLCSTLSNEELLSGLKNGSLQSNLMNKLEVKIHNRVLLAANDVVLRNSLVNSALRFKFTAGLENHLQEEFIGDGIVIATPLGSTGYYYSITRKTFTQGLGLAFNNIHNIDVDPIVTDAMSLTILVVRGPGQLSVDNNPEMLTLSDGDEIIINKSSKMATLLVPKK